MPLAVCPAVGGGYDAIICQEFGYASAPLGRERRPLFSLCFIVYQSIVLVSTSLPKTEVPEYLPSSLSVSVIDSLCALVRVGFWSMLLRLDLDLDWNLELDSQLDLDLRLDLDSKLDKEVDLEPT